MCEVKCNFENEVTLEIRLQLNIVCVVVQSKVFQS